MYQRKTADYLNHWKTKSRRKPLILRGARQVGKTTLINSFGSSFEHYITLNLERSEDRQFFERLANIHDLVQALRLRQNIPRNSDQVLLFIDEIQESPKAIQQLRYFYEDYPEIYVIAAGSLLEFALKEVPSFPVGRIEYLNLYPMDFEEFLVANEQSDMIEVMNEVPVPHFAHQSLLRKFHEYALLGGMPEIVKIYLETKDIVSLNEYYTSIWQAYKDDIPKYARNATEQKILRHVIETAPTEIDNRIKFEGFGSSNYRYREVGEALRALDLAGILKLIYPTTDLTPPISSDYKKRPRLQLLDSGLFAHTAGLQEQIIGIDDLHEVYKGKLIQHLVTQELIAQHHLPSFKPHFWVREKKGASAELDIIYPYGKYIIPIEVKSGKQGKLRSLHQFIDRCNHSYGLRIYAGEFKVEKAKTPGGKPYYLLNLPYYLAGKIPDYINWFVNKY